MNRGQDIITPFTFGALRVTIKGLGIYFGGEVLASRVAALTPEEMKAANQEAWKQKREATRAANRVNNVTIHGCGPYDRYCLHANVAQEVCRETWKQMCRAKEAA